MSSKFFNNKIGNTLFDKLKGIASEMATFDRFLAVVGFFRSSGYFKLRKELGDISEIKILVGINIDDIFRKHNKALLMLADEDKAKEIYQNEFKEEFCRCAKLLFRDAYRCASTPQRICTQNSISVCHRIIASIAMGGLLWARPISPIRDWASSNRHNMNSMWR